MSAPIPETMRCIEIVKPGGPEVLRLATRPTPKPGKGEVLVKVAMAGVNRPDVLQRLGHYPPPEGASDLPGLEVSGEVVAVGPDVHGERVGDKVCALLPGGGYAEYALAHEGSCLPVPRGLSMAEAAALPETCFTVWANVFEDGGLKGGETLLVHGGTSGIGVAAIAMAKAFDAQVVATASSAEKLDAIRRRGADHAFNYQTDKWEEEIAALGGVDVVLDMAGGDFVARNLQCLKPGGRHVSIAFLRGATAEVNIFAIMRKRLRLTGSTLRGRDNGEKARIAFALRNHVWPLIEAGRITPALDRIFPLADAARAHERMEAGRHIGKIVLAVSEE
ncbi:NAD(P)H-quinone oxidoreductase [Amphiplicatus metriothermophilus]|uniref:Putative NAD(P)H quinone oxidoreductase, PIG3 family n=1 Tax=Amphiplicatus metriothermophilus TaxID=1519374 RepID=A0A239PQ45_9PROT|nr:NAD(P)H-quinone oxidoreductase [Amphiplicatus metriothermophilus]MBB5518583.1 putative PIG3 family NAD(P)H quinone oxidoreductase [Amphiplicatus metriothermophilus]SNT72258.1 putative NAD(P)H quinone oxidoreductase, PIG3 family [Amphiplicatus metriothermophilus]